MKGTFISFEGIDYCGKSTQARQLEKYLREQQIPVIAGAEPGTTSLGQVLRRILKEPTRVYTLFNRAYRLDPDFSSIQLREQRTPQAETLLYLAARSEFIHHMVRPNLEQGRVVIADRFADSTRAYQGGGRFNHDAQILELIDQLNEFVVDGCWPDRTYLIDMPYAMLVERAQANGKNFDALESLGEDFFNRVIAEYRKIAQKSPERVVLIDGAQHPDVIFQQQIVPDIKLLLDHRSS